MWQAAQCHGDFLSLSPIIRVLCIFSVFTNQVVDFLVDIEESLIYFRECQVRPFFYYLFKMSNN